VPLQFDDLTFDADRRQLWLGQTEVQLSPKAFDLLSLLVARRPHAVAKADIHAHLWQGTFVSDSSLPSLVSEIREAIGDRRRKPRLVRTLHRFGYAFQWEEEASEANGAHDPGPGGWLIGASAEVTLAVGENIVGREAPGVVAVKSSTVSRRHARIAIGDTGSMVEDLGSKNGTYVNDRRIDAPVGLADGDQVRLGSLLFTFRLSARGTSTETVTSRSSASRLRP